MTQNSTKMMPAALLWNFELQREKRSMTQHVIQAKCQLDETEQLIRQLTTCLSDLTVFVTSIASSENDDTPQGQARLRLLRRHIIEIVEPLYANGKKIISRNEDLLDRIAKLRGLDNTPNSTLAITNGLPPGLPLPKGLFTPHADPAKELGSTPLTQALVNTQTLLNGSSYGSKPSDTKADEQDGADKGSPPMPMSKEEFNAKLSKVMKQNGRSIGDYFDAAHELRRQRMRTLRNGNSLDHTLIEAFLDGLDSNLYRRRFTHWLRKEHWTWNFLFHYAQILVMEEAYMAKQEYALEHKLEDGSVLFPDGERCYRFSYLPPITDEDLTASECGD